MATLPTSLMSPRLPPAVRSISWACLAVRWSFQMMAGRRGSTPPASRTSPCICPLSPMPAICRPGIFAAAMAARVALTVAAHQWRGSCSLQEGLGALMGWSALPVASTPPRTSMISVLVPDVPTSMPR